MMQEWFTEAKLGIFIHWGIYAVKPTGESWPFFKGEIPYEDYMAQKDGFTASKYDPQAWASLFKEAGARYVVLTTKHHDGVALWDTQFSDLNVVKNTPAGRNLIEPYCQALRNEDLRVGLYFSHLDWSHPDYATVQKDEATTAENAAFRDNEFTFRGKRDEVAWERFLTFHRNQLKELCTEFDPDLLWFDGSWERTSEQWRMKELAGQLQKWRPGVVVNSRMGGYGDYETPEQGVPIIAPEGPWEFCMTMNDHWGYMDSDTNYKTLTQIIRIFTECVSMGGNLLLDIGPKEDGTIPDEQVALLKGLGEWNAINQEAIFESKAGLPYGHFWGSSTLSKDESVIYLFLFDQPITEIPVKGIRNTIKSIRVIETGEKLNFKKIGGAPWLKIPGVLWISVPEGKINPNGTVLRIELEGSLDLCHTQGGEIAHN